MELVPLKGTGEGNGPTWLSAAGLCALHRVLEDQKHYTQMLLLLHTICQYLQWSHRPLLLRDGGPSMPIEVGGRELYLTTQKKLSVSRKRDKHSLSMTNSIH